NTRDQRQPSAHTFADLDVRGSDRAGDVGTKSPLDRGRLAALDGGWEVAPPRVLTNKLRPANADRRKLSEGSIDIRLARVVNRHPQVVLVKGPHGVGVREGN